MKKRKIIYGSILCMLVLLMSTFSVMATNSNVINGFNQVANIGGDNTSSDGVYVSKTIEESNLENYFDITLKVDTQSRIEEILKDQDLAIVIVMDISNTMNTKDVSSSSGAISRLLAAQNAANDFIDEFANYSNGVDAVRELGFVAFNTDAHQIFSLQECNNRQTASNLKNQMKTNTDMIALDANYRVSPTRFTNIEGGLKRAYDMLNSTQVQNKYIIFISDGFPTTYIENGYQGYNPYMTTKYNPSFVPSNYNSSGNGIFYNEFSNRLCVDGTNYSDEGARRAANLANSIKASGTNIFSIGISISDSRSVDINSYLTDVSIEEYYQKGGFEIGNNGLEYKNWLRNSIGSNSYYDVTATDELSNAYNSIFEKVKEISLERAEAAWVVEDPMGSDVGGSNIELIGIYDDNNYLHESININNSNQSDTALVDNNKISWDIKNSSYTSKVIDGVTHYTYELKYRVRLKNENNGFDINKIYNTNDTTTLSYVVRENGVLTEKTIDFPIPMVVGYLGKFNFLKKSSFDNSNLAGAKFILEHDTNCKCNSEMKHASDSDLTFIVYSDNNGVVNFDNIPSGHSYILREMEAPDGYVLSNETYKIEVNYGVVTGGPSDMIFKNDLNTTDLIITKEVISDNDNNDKFEFKLEVTYNNQLLTGKYPYIINNVDNGVIDLSKGIITLGDNDIIKISNLPVNATYTIRENNTDGFVVSYMINNQNSEYGDVVVCNSDTSCSLIDGENTIKFINEVGYILPEAGSSYSLILIGLLIFFFGSPIVYLGYIVYRK